jgi:uncharacterized protein (TIGR03000 family)
MNRPSLKCLLIGAVAVVALSALAPQADAQCWSCYRPAAWSCYSACYTPCCATARCYSPFNADCGWYLGCRPGPIRRALFGPCKWYWGGCYTGCYTGCATVGTWSTAESCCNGGTAAPTPGAPTPAPTPAQKPAVAPTMPMEPTPAAPAPAQPAPPKTTGMTSDESGVLAVWVPNDAKVTVNGQETTSKGSRRQFISYGLKPGLSYKYVVKAEVVRNGEVQEDSRTIVLTAGDVTAVAIPFNLTQQVAAAQ